MCSRCGDSSTRKEYKPDTATRKVGLLESVMGDQPSPGVDFADWFHRWLDPVGECEQAPGRMICTQNTHPQRA